VDGKALRIRETLVLEDPSGAELFTVQEKKLHIRDTMEIERDGHTVATVKKGSGTPTGSRLHPGSKTALILAVTVCIDQMTRA
jgi:uncharacterized protein YxjI